MWTQNELTFLMLNKDKMRQVDLAKRVNKSADTVRHMIKKIENSGGHKNRPRTTGKLKKISTGNFIEKNKHRSCTHNRNMK